MMSLCHARVLLVYLARVQYIAWWWYLLHLKAMMRSFNKTNPQNLKTAVAFAIDKST